MQGDPLQCGPERWVPNHTAACFCRRDACPRPGGLPLRYPPPSRTPRAGSRDPPRRIAPPPTPPRESCAALAAKPEPAHPRRQPLGGRQNPRASLPRCKYFTVGHSSLLGRLPNDRGISPEMMYLSIPSSRRLRRRRRKRGASIPAATSQDSWANSCTSTSKRRELRTCLELFR